MYNLHLTVECNNLHSSVERISHTKNKLLLCQVVVKREKQENEAQSVARGARVLLYSDGTGRPLGHKSESR